MSAGKNTSKLKPFHERPLGFLFARVMGDRVAHRNWKHHYDVLYGKQNKNKNCEGVALRKYLTLMGAVADVGAAVENQNSDET
jgi:hypothetical protein